MEKGQTLLSGGYSSYTPTGSNLFKRAGRWYITPNPGDVVYFYNKNLGRIGHVGIVISVDTTGKTFKTVEGNSSGSEFTCNGGCVASHSYSYTAVGGTNRVQGFGRPVFGSGTCTAEEFIAMAKSQLGYEEKKSNAQLDDFHANAGEANYTKYGKWYGMNPAQWCQMFVSWCADQACKAHKEEAPKVVVQKPAAARSFDRNAAGTYKTTTDLNLRLGPSKSYAVVETLREGTKLVNYGYYSLNESDGRWWMYVVAPSGACGYCSKKYLQKI